MINKNGYTDKRVELLIDLLEGALQDDGYKTIRMSDTKDHITTEYDCLIVKDWEYCGRIITLTISNRGNECYKDLFKGEKK